MTQFSAKEPSLGYHYQVRYALYLLITTKDKDDHFVRLENLDDVEIGDLNTLDLHQTKFHNNKAANLSDASVDLWKTLRVWSEMIRNKQIDLDNGLFVLVTTSKISNNSILYKLTENSQGSKTTEEIVIKLNEVSQKSTNQTLTSAFEEYNKLSSIEKEKLVENIYIRDEALSFDDLKEAIKRGIDLVCLPQYTDMIYEQLEGWWYEQTIQHLQGSKSLITYDETRRYLLYIADKLKTDNLMIDNIIRSSTVEDDDFENRIFVNQLRTIKLGKNTIRSAKRDFYRASEQRAKWLREKLLNPQEEIDYEAKLIDEWYSKSALLIDEIEDCSTEETEKKCKHFYLSYYVKTYPQIFIRPRVTDPFIVIGSYQMLADKQHVFWHPKFQK